MTYTVCRSRPCSRYPLLEILRDFTPLGGPPPRVHHPPPPAQPPRGPSRRCWQPPPTEAGTCLSGGRLRTTAAGRMFSSASRGTSPARGEAHRRTHAYQWEARPQVEGRTYTCNKLCVCAIAQGEEHQRWRTQRSPRHTSSAMRPPHAVQAPSYHETASLKTRRSRENV